MGSVIDTIECPRCKQEAINDFYYKTGEEYTTCHNCGYYSSLTIIDREKPLSDPNNWKLVESHKPFGSYRIATFQGPGYQVGTLETEDDYLRFKFEMDRHPEIKSAIVSRYVNGEIVTENVIG